MANSLLDFVMSVVRDPDVAAQYAANPAQAIADAHLTDVSTADVNGLIPVVTESISAAPSTGLDAFGDGGNIWSSGAATAAFDAFDDHLPVQGLGDHVDSGVITDAFGPQDGVVNTGFDAGDGVHAPVVADDPGLGFDAPLVDSGIDGGPPVDAAGLDDWNGLDGLHDVGHEAGLDPHTDTPGFDVFD